MSVSFRGVQQEFSNVYHYQRVGLVEASWEGYLDEVVSTMRSLYSTDVSFKRGNVWSADGTPGQNTMLGTKNLTGTGNQVVNPNMDRERAFLVRWRAGKDIRGKPVYLRKWLHSCGSANGVGASNAVLQQTASLDTATRTAIQSKAEELREIGTFELLNLCSATGRNAEGGANCHLYLEHHQLGDMWR